MPIVQVFLYVFFFISDAVEEALTPSLPVWSVPVTPF
jgi:hypothetical protein